MPGVLPYPYNGQNNIINFVGARGKLSFIELHTIIFPGSWAHRKGNIMGQCQICPHGIAVSSEIQRSFQIQVEVATSHTGVYTNKDYI